MQNLYRQPLCSFQYAKGQNAHGSEHVLGAMAKNAWKFRGRGPAIGGHTFV